MMHITSKITQKALKTTNNIHYNLLNATDGRTKCSGIVAEVGGNRERRLLVYAYDYCINTTVSRHLHPKGPCKYWCPAS